MPPRHQSARRAYQRIVPPLIAAAIVIAVSVVLARTSPDSHASDAPTTETSTTTSTLVPTSSTSSTTTVPATPADQLHLVQIGQYSSPEITPKSVDAA